MIWHTVGREEQKMAFYVEDIFLSLSLFSIWEIRVGAEWDYLFAVESLKERGYGITKLLWF